MTVAQVPTIAGQNAQSPDWWVARLYGQISERRKYLDFFSDYYEGDHPLPWLAPQARAEFKRIMSMTRSNYMGLVVDAMVERIHVEGFKLGGQETSDDASWNIWQVNDMDSMSDQGWLEAAVGGCAYFMVEPNLVDSANPIMRVEHGSQAITENYPGSRIRKAGLKTWVDDWTGLLNATLFLMRDPTPTTAPAMFVFKYQAEAPSSGSTTKPDWQRRTVAGEAWGANTQIPFVPLRPIENNPRLLTGGRSELYDLTDIQDRVNKTLADRLVTQDYGSFPQKWAIGWPSEDDQGNENKVDVGRNRMMTTDVPKTEAEFGSFTTADLKGYNDSKHEDVKDIASRSRTPAQYLLGEMANVNGDTLKASESGLIAKVKERMRNYAEAAEEAMRMARFLAGISGDPVSESRMETIFANPEFRTEGEITDAAIKRRQTGITPLRQTRVDLGYSQTQIEDMEKADAKEATMLVKATQQALLQGGSQPTDGLTGAPGPAAGV
jgi:hypothetical protein